MLLSKKQKSALGVARLLSKWFQITIEIRLFGKLVWSYKWPPSSDSLLDEELPEISSFINH